MASSSPIVSTGRRVRRRADAGCGTQAISCRRHRLLAPHGEVATPLDRLGPDRGTRYRPAIFPANAEQARVGRACVAQLNQAGVYDAATVTKIEPSRVFFPAEDTKALAKQLLEKGIRANVVAPGPFWTALQASGGQPPEKVMTFGEESQYGRPGQPVEIAPVYVLLASQEGSYITGEVYGVTGGAGVA